MPNDNVVRLIQPEAFDDQLTEALRQGARALLAQAVEAEVSEFLGKHAECKTEDGHQRVVRHGHLPEREVVTLANGKKFKLRHYRNHERRLKRRP